jgi:hypothetical protein
LDDYFFIDGETARFLAELKHWLKGCGGLPAPPTQDRGGILATQLEWIKLTEDLPPDGEADGHLCRWDPTAKQSTEDDEAIARVVSTGGISGAVDDRVLARPLGVDGGIVWEALLIPRVPLYGVADADIASGKSGSVSIWAKNASGTMAATGEKKTALAPWILTTGKIPKGKRVWMMHMGDELHILNWEC